MHIFHFRTTLRKHFIELFLSFIGKMFYLTRLGELLRGELTFADVFSCTFYMEMIYLYALKLSFDYLSINILKP